MDAFIKFLQAFFSFVIIIPLSLFCLLPLKNQLKYPISKIVTLFLCSFIILGSLSSIVMTEFPIVKDTTPNITNSRLNNIP